MTADPAAEDEEGVRLRAHPALCLGFGNCRRFGPGVYSLDAEGMIDFHLLDVPADLALEAWRGASVCPQRAITVIGRPESYWVERQADMARSQPVRGS